MHTTPFPIVPLGDQAVLVSLLDEQAAVGFSSAVRQAGWPWLFDVVPAYATVGVHFDANQIRFKAVVDALQRLSVPTSIQAKEQRRHNIPCCYEMQIDLARVAEMTKLSEDEVIKHHCGRDYTIHAIGFAPGFPYLGYLPPELCGVSRLQSPRLRVPGGSVGLTGAQTGIYPQERPGGWNLIGRTPLVLVDVEDEYFPLQVGQRICFQRIDEAEYRRLVGERLPIST